VAKLTFFFDRTFGVRLPEVLARMSPPMHIRWHQKHGFAQNTTDDEWLAQVGAAGWVVISQDRKFHLVDVELAAIKQHKIRCFYLRCASEHRWISLCNLTRAHKRMINLAETHPPPFIYDMRQNGGLYPIKLP